MTKDGYVKMGRPTKYKPEFCSELIEFMAQGYSFEAFAGKIKVNQDTLHEWCKVHKEFSEAKKLGFAECRLFWEGISIKGVWNTTEGPNINVGMFVFNMKNRFKWTDRVEVSGSEDAETKPIVLKYSLAKSK